MPPALSTMDLVALSALLGMIGLGVGAAWKLSTHFNQRVREAEARASAGDARLHERVDELAAGTISRQEMVQHLTTIQGTVGEVRDDIRDLRTGMEALANAVIAGAGKAARARGKGE